MICSSVSDSSGQVRRAGLDHPARFCNAHEDLSIHINTTFSGFSIVHNKSVSAPMALAAAFGFLLV